MFLCFSALRIHVSPLYNNRTPRHDVTPVPETPRITDCPSRSSRLLGLIRPRRRAIFLSDRFLRNKAMEERCAYCTILFSKKECQNFFLWSVKTPKTVIIILLHKLDEPFSLIPKFVVLSFYVRAGC